MNLLIHTRHRYATCRAKYRHSKGQYLKYLAAIKLTHLFILFSIQVSATATAQNVTLDVKNAKLRDVLHMISVQTHMSTYMEDQDDVIAKPITITLKSTPIETTLQSIFLNQPFTYKIDGNLILVRRKETGGKVVLPLTSNALTTIQGTVLSTDGQPLAGASVMIVGQANHGTITNDQGSFILSNVPESGKLLVRMIGYGTKEVSYGANSKPRILLTQINTDMDAVQIIGYGKVSKRLNTGNVGSITSSDIEKQNINNPILALQGRIPGVEITQNKGVPGGGVKIKIRGVNTLTQGTDPLFVVDGVPYHNDMFSTPYYSGLNVISGGSGINPLSLINPTDIESIDVLKDADATAIYGSRGANGVILITTKKGKAGPMKLDVNTQTGFGNVSRRAKFLNTSQYIEMRKEAFKNDDVTPTTTNARDLLIYDQNSYTDWQDVMIGNTSVYHNTQASVSGGTDNIQYLIGSNYHRETTVFPGDWADEKVSVHFNISSNSQNQKFKTTFSGSYLTDRNRLPVTDFAQYISMAPNAPSLYLPDGSLDWNSYSNNPFRDLKTDYIANSKNLIANSILSYVLLPGLELVSSFGYNTILLNEKRMLPISSNNPARGVTTGSSSFNDNNLSSWIIEPQINYSRNFGKGKLHVLLGGTIQHRQIEGQIVNGLGYTDDGLLGTLAGAAEITKGETIFEEYRYSSVLGRINYSWNTKYLLNLTGRRDGSSRFGPGKQYGNFGAIGLAWIFSKEDFLRDALPIVSFGKLRASYGTSGNEPAKNYEFYELYNISAGFPYGGGSGIFPDKIPTSDYRWEVNRKSEIGLELGLFDDRIVATTSYFRNRSSNQLVTRPLASSVGFGSIIANFPAVVQNKGWEFTLSTVNLKRKNFQWNTGFNLGFVRNKLLKYDGNEFFGNFKVGEPLNTTLVYKFAGVDPTSGYYQFYTHDGKITMEPSDEDRFTRVNLDQRFSGGFQNSFSLGNLTLDINFQFVKQTGQNYLFSNSLPPGFFSRSQGLGNQPVDVLDRSQPGKTQSNYQKFTQSIDGLNSYTFAKGSDRIYTDASYIRLKNASLSYLLPEKLTKRIKMKNLRVYLQGQNLLTITNYKGTDPEVQDIMFLPTLRVITMGLQLTL